MKIDAFKLSMFWAETNLALLRRDAPADAPLAHLGRYGGYVKAFDDAQYRLRAGEALPQPAPPWGRTKGEHFWTYYAGGRSNAAVNGNQAWHRVIPFRASLPATVEITPPLEEVMLDLFFYPHGIAFLVTLCWSAEEGETLEEAAAQAFDLRHGRRYRLTWQAEPDALFGNLQWPGAGRPDFSLSQLAAHALTTAHQAAFGPTVARGERTAPEPDPFVVVTPLEGADVDLTQLPQAQEAILAALHALASGAVMRVGAGLPSPESADVGMGKDAGISDLLYGEHRARVIWYPSRFTAADPSSRFILDCYHNNLALASLQTESLCGLARVVAARLDRGATLSSHERELARYATNMVGLLYGSAEDTYHSYSPRRQIDQNRWADAVNRVRRYFNNDALY